MGISKGPMGNDSAWSRCSKLPWGTWISAKGHNEGFGMSVVAMWLKKAGSV